MLALYHFGPIANSLTPLLCLIEKGIDFDDCFLNSRLWEHHSPEFQAINPQGMVPVLVHDDRVVTESTVINEYLEDVFPDAPLRPADPVSACADADVDQICRRVFLPGADRARRAGRQALRFVDRQGGDADDPGAHA